MGGTGAVSGPTEAGSRHPKDEATTFVQNVVAYLPRYVDTSEKTVNLTRTCNLATRRLHLVSCPHISLGLRHLCNSANAQQGLMPGVRTELRRERHTTPWSDYVKLSGPVTATADGGQRRVMQSQPVPATL
jgi:hypothetical protein